MHKNLRKQQKSSSLISNSASKSNASSFSQKQTDIRSSWKGKNITQSDFDDRIVKFVTGTMSALSIINSQYFKQIFSDMPFKVMSRGTLMTKIAGLNKSMLSTLREKISPVEYVCTAADI